MSRIPAKGFGNLCIVFPPLSNCIRPRCVGRLLSSSSAEKFMQTPATHWTIVCSPADGTVSRLYIIACFTFTRHSRGNCAFFLYKAAAAAGTGDSLHHCARRCDVFTHFGQPGPRRARTNRLSPTLGWQLAKVRSFLSRQHQWGTGDCCLAGWLSGGAAGGAPRSS
ncbi:hypothetical protein Mapa_004843 [Marchantia paleacea]|nr:hypothetical protein Mapa_004843 [Marchantia paleacea]